MRLIPRLVPLLALPTLILGTALVSAAPASAATLSGAIRTVTITDSDGGTTPAQGSQLATNITWCVPDGSHEDDTFSLTLDDHLRRLPAGFTLDDPATGVPVATAAITSTSPWVATFTLTNYAESHTGVCGTAYVKSDFDGVSTPTGVRTPFTSTTNDGLVFTTDITPTGPVFGDGTQPSKYGTWTNADQGQADPTDFLTWHVDTPDGRFDSATTIDTVPDGELWRFDCDTVHLVDGAIDDDGDYQPLAAPNGDVTAAVPFECSDTQVTVHWPAQTVDGNRYRLEVASSLDAPVGSDTDPATFSNDAQVNTIVGDTERSFATSASLMQASGGGDGSGADIPLPPASPPTSPTPPTTPPSAPTPTPTPDNGSVGPAAAAGPSAAATGTRVTRSATTNGAADELAMTGQDDTAGIAIGAGMVALGLVLTLLARRRRNASR